MDIYFDLIDYKVFPELLQFMKDFDKNSVKNFE